MHSMKNKQWRKKQRLHDLSTAVVNYHPDTLPSLVITSNYLIQRNNIKDHIHMQCNQELITVYADTDALRFCG